MALLLCTGLSKIRAQNDPVLASMILQYTEKAEKELQNQKKVMLMQTTGHIWTKEEVEATTNLQREFNNYLDCQLRGTDIRILPRGIEAD